MTHNPPNRPRFRRGERGVLLIWVGVTLMVIAGLVVSTMGRQQALEDSASFESAAPAHARDVAEAGIVDALAWFRRQSDQPVAAFAPKRDLGANPPVNETDDPALGIVRSYEVAPNLWARYEVAIGQVREPFSDDNGNGWFDQGENWTDANGNGRRDGDTGVLDITAQRSASGTGIVWRLESRGAIFHKVDNQPLGQGRNLRIAEARLATEIRRMAIRTPASAALCAARADRVTIGPRARIGGDPGAAIAYASSTGFAAILSGAQLTGSPGLVATPDMDVSLQGVFDTDLGGLRAAADLATDDPSSVPAPLPTQSLVVIEGDITFTDARPLRGTAIVVVTGNCTIANGSNSFFGGILWVGGNLVVRAPALISGTILVNGTADIRGLSGDFVEVHQDDDVVRGLFQTLGQYRFTKAIHPADGQDAPRPSTGGA
jgi:hypothetical protein